MGKYDALKNSLGIQTNQTDPSKGRYDQLKMSLGLIPDTRVDPVKAKIDEVTKITESPLRKPVDVTQLPSASRTPSPVAPSTPVSTNAAKKEKMPSLGNIVKKSSQLLLKGTVLDPLEAVGRGVDKFERFTGLNKVGGAMKGFVNPTISHENPFPDDGTYLGAYKNAAGGAIKALRDYGSSIAEGFKNPDETSQRFNQTNKQIKEKVFDPVSGTAFDILANTATDPLSYIPAERIAKLTSSGVQKLAGTKAGEAVSDLVKGKPPSYEGVSLTNSGLEQNAKTLAAEKMQGNWFTNLFGDSGVGISAVGDSRRLSKEPLNTSEQIVNRSIKTDAQGVKASVAAQSRAAYQNFVDRLDPLKRISNQTYDTAMDAARANNIANQVVRDKFVNLEGQVLGEGLSNIFKKVARGEDKNFVDYLTLRHAATRMARGEKVYADSLGMTVESVADRLATLEKRYPGFSDIAKEWDGFNDNVLQTFGVKEGLITPEAYAAMREKNPNYSPMRRQFLKSEKPGRSSLAKTTSSSFSGQKAPIQKVSPTGSARLIVDPRKTTVESVGAWTNAAMRNRTMQSMVDAVKRDPEFFKDVAEIVQKPTGKKNLQEILTNGGQDDFLEALEGDFKDLFKTSRVDGDNVVRAMVNGEPVYLKVKDPEIVKTLIGMGPQASNALLDVVSAFSNATKRGATGVFAPVFAVKGATMDLVQSAIQAKNPAKQAAYTVYSIFSGIGDRLNIPGLKNLAEEFRLAGGEYSAALKGDRRLNTSIRDMTRDPLLSGKGVLKGAERAVKAPFQALEAVGNIAENAPRMAAYKLEMQRLGGAKTPENIRQAMSQSREITTNFSRKGALSRDIEAFVPYNNAAVQGTYRVLKGIKQNPVRTAAAIGALSVLPKMLEYMQFADDPDYQNLPARERFRFLIVNKNADGTFTKIPMEPAYNSFGELAIEALRKYKDNDPNAFRGTADALLNAWTPPALTGALQGVTQGGGLDKSIAGAVNSTVAAPFVATTANQSFTGSPIVPQSVADRSPQYQYDERTSSIAKEIGKITNMSPMKVDYLIRAYGGDPARLLLPLTSDVGQGNTRNTLLKNFIVDPEFTNTLTDDFYSAKERLNQAYNDYKDLKVPLPSWYSDSLRQTVNSSAENSISKRISSLRNLKKSITNNKELTAKERTDRIREVQEKINNIYVDINSKLQKVLE